MINVNPSMQIKTYRSIWTVSTGTNLKCVESAIILLIMKLKHINKEHISEKCVQRDKNAQIRKDKGKLEN